MTFSAVSAALFFHPVFVKMTRSTEKFVAHLSLVLAEERPVGVVELLDDLEGPPPVEHVVTDEVGLHPLGHGVVPRVPQRLARLAEQQIRVAYQLVERVQMASGPFDELQRLGQLAHGVHRGITRVSHRGDIPAPTTP